MIVKQRKGKKKKSYNTLERVSVQSWTFSNWDQSPTHSDSHKNQKKSLNSIKSTEKLQ